MFYKYKRIPHQCVIKGDGIYASIAAASILAKTYRDEYMRQLHYEFPHYGWFNNKGYGTPNTAGALKRMAFAPITGKASISSVTVEIFDELLIGS